MMGINNNHFMIDSSAPPVFGRTALISRLYTYGRRRPNPLLAALAVSEDLSIFNSQCIQYDITLSNE